MDSDANYPVSFKIFQQSCHQIHQQHFLEEPYAQLISINSLFAKFCQTIDLKLAELKKYPTSFDPDDKY